MLYEPWPGSRVGASYRSAIHQTLRGNARFDVDRAGVGAALQTRGLFQDGAVSANVTTPETASIGFYHELSDDWALLGQAEFTRWSRFKDLTIKFNDDTQSDIVSTHDWNGTWFFALGATWRPDEAWKIRGGIAFDQDPIPNDRRTPRIPTDDRFLFSLGADYQPFHDILVSLAYTHVFQEDAPINLSASQTGNRFSGNLSGRAEVSADILSIEASWRF